jgi:translation elongation factor EF-4
MRYELGLRDHQGVLQRSKIKINQADTETGTETYTIFEITMILGTNHIDLPSRLPESVSERFAKTIQIDVRRAVLIHSQYQLIYITYPSPVVEPFPQTIDAPRGNILP